MTDPTRERHDDVVAEARAALTSTPGPDVRLLGAVREGLLSVADGPSASPSTLPAGETRFADLAVRHRSVV